ncbi:NF-kappa-B-repressing factor [Rana temporaria]|uniref:NF-kappa-B-repressing factor n=1 Tax=Rana temporaria TaxID=8407 RepID=UPI001AADD6EC|nr:NF-kappa-B-repressing factor [Rana temporaria]
MVPFSRGPSHPLLYGPTVAPHKTSGKCEPVFSVERTPGWCVRKGALPAGECRGSRRMVGWSPVRKMAGQSEHGTWEERPVCLEEFRQYHENDKQWAARREFLARHIHLYPGRKTDQLIALSLVWSNIVYIGNRYGDQLTEKVHQMAEGIDIGEVTSYELVPGAKAAKRSSSPDADGQPSKKKFGPRPRFEPVHFVSSTVEEDKVFQKTRETNTNLDRQTEWDSIYPSNAKSQETAVCTTVSDHSDAEEHTETELSCRPYVYDPNDTDDQNRNDSVNFMTKMEQDYSAKFESHYSSLGKDFRSNVLDSWTGISPRGRKGIGFVKPPKKTGRTGIEKQSNANHSMARAGNSVDKPGIKHLSAIVKLNLENPKMTSDGRHINFTHVLTQSIQACKTNPEYIYVPIKDLPPGSIPKHKGIPPDGFACEVRYQDVYLATGYSWSKIVARDRAAELAIQLLQKPLVDVATVQRQCGSGYRDDTVACSADMRMNNFPPALKHDDAFLNDSGQSSQHFSESTKGTSSRPWSEFILTDNAFDAIGILNNSATFNKMTVAYKYDMMSNNTWRCSVYVQDHFIAEAFGNKKSSKHSAAELAVNMLKSMQPNIQRAINTESADSGLSKELKDIVVYENASNPVCTLNDTAQFNKVAIEYVFERASGLDWKCKVLIGQQFVAEAVGFKKTVKHDAAYAAVEALKRTQPVVVNNLKRGPSEDAISRNRIRGLSNEDAYKQQIKEDNIGNQLLRKMGWTGGGLGKEGEGIAEPISVKEQFSREGLGLMTTNQKITKRDIEQMIRNYANSCNQDDLTFSRELTNEERKYIHQISQRYGLKSKSHGQGKQRFLVVSRKRSRQDLLLQLKQEGQVGSYALVMPDN